MRVLNLTIPALLVAMWVSGCATTDIRALREELLRADQAWAEAVRGDDVNAITAYWTDDATIYFSGRPPVSGKKSLREMVARNRATPGFSLTWEATEAVVSKSGDVGYTLGTYELTIPRQAADPVVQRGNHICIWRRTESVWRCSLEFHAAVGRPK